MSSDEPSNHEPGARILDFRRPGAGGPSRRPAGSNPGTDAEDDLARFSRDETPDDYGHRMTINVIAFAFVIGLVLAGYWLADTMATTRKNQDCVLSGRRNCAEVAVPAGERF